MEQILFLIAIVVIDALLKRAKAKKKSEQQPSPWHAPEDDSTQEFEEEQNDEDFDERADDQATPPPRPFVARKLQEYIKQFEEAQREAEESKSAESRGTAGKGIIRKNMKPESSQQTIPTFVCFKQLSHPECFETKPVQEENP